MGLYVGTKLKENMYRGTVLKVGTVMKVWMSCCNANQNACSNLLHFGKAGLESSIRAAIRSSHLSFSPD